MKVRFFFHLGFVRARLEGQDMGGDGEGDGDLQL